MFAKVYQYKFPGVSEAKVAASYCSDKLGKKIVEFDFEGLNIMIGKDGDLSIIIKFSESSLCSGYYSVKFDQNGIFSSAETTSDFFLKFIFFLMFLR